MNNMSNPAGSVLLLSDARGIYIPQNFVEAYDPTKWGLTKKQVKTLLKGPYHKWYWETWDEVLNNASYRTPEGHVYTLYQEGDLWAVCPETFTNEEYEWFYQEPRQEEEE